MKFLKILVLIFTLLMVPVYADQNQTIQITGGCSKYKKHKISVKRFVKTKKYCKNTKQKQKNRKLQKVMVSQNHIPEIYQYQNSVEINNPDQIFINPVITQHIQTQPQLQQTQYVPQPQPSLPIPTQPTIQNQNKKTLLKIGMNTGSMKITCGDETETFELDSSLVVGAEYAFINDLNLQTGIGASCELNKNNNTFPVYGFVKYKINQVNLTGSLGYSFFSLKEPKDNIKVKNGMYFSVGLEVPIHTQFKLFSDFLSYTNQISVSDPCLGNLNFDYLYNKMSFGLKLEI